MIRNLAPLYGLAVLAIAVALVFDAGPAPAAEAPSAWTVDEKKSHIFFIGRQMGAASKGEFKKFTAKVRFDPKNLEASKVEVVVDAASGHTGNGDIDKEMKRPKWFDVKRFPTARFVTTAFHAKGGNAFEATGKLTIRDVTREVVLPFKVEAVKGGGGAVAKVTGELTIKRTVYGIGQAEWSSTRIVADDVVIQIVVVAKKGG